MLTSCSGLRLAAPVGGHALPAVQPAAPAAPSRAATRRKPRRPIRDRGCSINRLSCSSRPPATRLLTSPLDADAARRSGPADDHLVDQQALAHLGVAEGDLE